MATSVKTDLLLTRDPSSALHAVTKQYADAGDLDAARGPGYPMDQYGLVGASMHIDAITGVSIAQPTVSTLEAFRVYVPANKAITGAVSYVGTIGVTPGSTNGSGYAVYTDDGSSRLAVTANDYTLFTSTGWRPKAFTGSVAAQSTGRFVRVCLLHSCSGTAPKFAAGVALGAALFDAFIPSGTHRRGLFITATTAFPTSFVASSAGSNDSPMIFLGLY